MTTVLVTGTMDSQGTVTWDTVVSAGDVISLKRSIDQPTWEPILRMPVGIHPTIVSREGFRTRSEQPGEGVTVAPITSVRVRMPVRTAKVAVSITAQLEKVIVSDDELGWTHSTKGVEGGVSAEVNPISVVVSVFRVIHWTGSWPVLFRRVSGNRVSLSITRKH